jgi:hypothetical protein
VRRLAEQDGWAQRPIAFSRKPSSSMRPVPVRGLRTHEVTTSARTKSEWDGKYTAQ